MTATPVRTTCPYCGVGCGVIATPAADGTVDIAGDPEHPANYGRLCSKGAALGETVGLDGRLLYPEVDGTRATWDDALDIVARRFSATIAEHGAGSVAFYVSGQILTEDYYAANKLMKGYIGTANIDTNSRLCMASSVAGHKRAFGADTVPGCYEDLEQADLVVLVGSNLAWCHPVLYQRLAAARERRGTRVVVVDPRRTATCALADHHLAIAPDSDIALFEGLLTYLSSAGALDRDFIDRHTNGFEQAAAAAWRVSPAAAARATGLSERAISSFYRLFAEIEKVVTVFSQGVNQSASGTDKVNAIINCHLATGRIGRAGMGPFSVTGQPNAMGGREVGGLANMLAAHMELADPDHRQIVQTFWGSPRIADTAGLKAVDMFEAVGDGRIKALWIMATNPVVSLPEAGRVQAALAACPFVVVSDVERSTDTTRYANILLPSLAWGEKNGTVTNSERRISRQRAFLPAPGECRPDWWQISEVARRMGFEAGFDWQGPDEIFAEHAALSGAGNGGRRDFDISRHGEIAASAYDAMAPFQWPDAKGAEKSAETSSARLFADGRFFTPDGRARFVAAQGTVTRTATDDATLVLNTGRIRDQWHTMTRTGRSPRLSSHVAEPFVEINPVDAARFGVESATLATVSNARGSVVLRVVATDRVAPGTLFAPIHWTDQNSSCARIGMLVDAMVDPVSGQPALKQSRASIEPYAAKWYAFAAGIGRPAVGRSDYWALGRTRSGWQAELAGLGTVPDARHVLLAAWPEASDAMEILAYRDRARGEARVLAFRDTTLVAALFMALKPVACARAFIAESVGSEIADPSRRYLLLAGRPGSDRRDTGPIVCACFEVGRNDIAAAVRGGASTVAAVGAATRAGSNCGSCRAEIGGLIDATRHAQTG